MGAQNAHARIAAEADGRIRFCTSLNEALGVGTSWKHLFAVICQVRDWHYPLTAIPPPTPVSHKSVSRQGKR
jgi:hypothetical protein